MLYKFFPTTLYGDILITDLLKKIKVSDRFKKTIAVENYRVKEEDTPESLAYLLYNDSTFSWLILLMNDIMDRNTEWPYNQSSLDRIIDEKYNTSSLFLRDSDITFNISEATRFSVSNSCGGSSDFYDVKTIDRQFNKITTKEKLPLSVNDGDQIVFYKANDRLHTGCKTVRKVVYEDTFSIHHFEDEQGNYIDPRSMVNSNAIYNEQFTYLYQYIADGGSVVSQNVVSNFTYEVTQNDIKRDILLLLPEYKDAFVSSVNRIFQNSNKDINVLELNNLVEFIARDK
jgi:hypothetical protein